MSVTAAGGGRSGTSLVSVTDASPEITLVACGDVYDMNDGKSNTNPNGDTWFTYWTSSNEVLTSINDGAGWDSGTDYAQRGFGRLTGNPNYNNTTFWGVSLNPGTLGTARDNFNQGGKGYHMGIYEQDGILYDCINNYDSTPPYSAFIKSVDGGRNWINHLGGTNVAPALTNAATSMFKWDNPNFVRFGRGSDVPAVDQAGKYLYLVASSIYVGRVERSRFPALNRNDYEWYRGGGLDGMLDSSWSTNQEDAVAMTGLYGPVAGDVSHPYSVGCPVYNYGLRKYIATGYSAYWPPGETRNYFNWASGLPRYHLYSSDHPWGPWTDAGNFSLWGSTVAEYMMCNKYTSADGKKMWICTAGSLPNWTGWTTHAPWQYGFQYMPVYFSRGPVVRYEAEDAARGGSVINESTYPSWSGSGYATGLSAGAGFIRFAVTQEVASAGWYIARFRYTNPSQNANTLSVYVNGGKARTIRLARNDSDNDAAHCWTYRSDIYRLPAGSTNSIELRCDAGDSGTGVKIDSLDVATEPSSDEGRNVAVEAAVTASSGVAANAAKGYVNYTTEWTAAGTTGEWIKLDWSPESRTVNKVVLYDRTNMASQVLSGHLTFSDGSTVAVGKLQNDGMAGATLVFPAKVTGSVKFTVDSVKSGTVNAGLGELQVYEPGTSLPANGAVAGDDAAAAIQGVPVVLDVLANDADHDAQPLVISSVNPPQHGSVSNGTSALIYTADGSYSGTDTFSYVATAVSGCSATGVVSVTVRAAPVPMKMKLRFAGYTRNESLTNFPVLVAFSNGMGGGFSYSQAVSAAGYDLRFRDADESTLLNHEIDAWNTNGVSFVWVQVPVLSNGASILAYWGDATNAGAPAVYTTNGATWAGAYRGVWHLANGSTLNGLDSTSNRNDVTSYNCSAAGGMVNGAAVVSASNQYMQASDRASLRISGKLTVSAWVRQTSHARDSVIVQKRDTVTPTAGYNYGCWIVSTTGKLFFQFNDGVSYYGYTDTAPEVPLNVWTMVTFVVDDAAQKVCFYQNGAGTSQTKASSMPAGGSAPVQIGNFWPYNRAGFQLNGGIDEVRISNEAQSSNWIWACYQTVASNDSFVVCEQAVPVESGRDMYGIPDNWKLAYFGSTNGLLTGGTDDWDGDGMNNLAEYRAGTDPTNRSSLLIVTQMTTVSGSNFVLRWPSAAGRYYGITCATNLLSGADVILNSNIPATPDVNTTTVTVSQAQEFFRIRVE